MALTRTAISKRKQKSQFLPALDGICSVKPPLLKHPSHGDQQTQLWQDVAESGADAGLINRQVFQSDVSCY
ncbi:hypothetical protein TorRG33x02_095580 [Trema orientale]|uniref:Uncharacterized protein n=1 Tax=Trema orientale TaxID=63057 RepID=A0A2P5FAH1_TREOI|nr:hypothetical protein TorRG33x02_095580 [Trema orientale]